MNALLPAIVCAVLWSLESAMPLYRFGDERFRRALPNLGLTALLLATNLALSFGVAMVADRRVVVLPAWLQLVAGVVALDFFAYVAHVLLHRMPLGWRFHRVHHSDAEVNVTTAFRQHPGETVWRVLWQLPAVVLLGLPLWVVAVYLTISAVNAQLEHANVRVGETLDRVLRLAVVTPNMHKVHHSRHQPETDSNYANIFSVWDRLFGTYTRSVDFATLRYGLDDVDERAARRLRGLLAMPFAR